jgi:hypothetical protein
MKRDTIASAMNLVRVWILRLAAVAAIAMGAYLLYDSYQDLSWGRRAIQEAGASAYTPGATQNEILAESAEKDRSGAASENTGLLLIAAGLLMDGITSVLKKLETKSLTA